MTGIIRSPFLDSGVHLMSPVTIYDSLLWGGSVPFGNLWNGIDYDYVGWDPLPQMLNKTIFDHGFHDSYFALGVAAADLTSAQDLEVSGHKPRNWKYRADWDHHRYGSLLGNLAILGANPDLAAARFKRDHELIHYNIKGSADAEFLATETQWYTFPFVRLGWVLPGVATIPSGPAGYGLALYSRVGASSSQLNPSTTFVNNSVSLGGANAITQRVLETLGDEFSIIGDGAGSRLNCLRTISDLAVEETPRRLRISYLYTIEEFDVLGNWGKARYKVRFDWNLVPTAVPLAIGAFSSFRWLNSLAKEVFPAGYGGNFYTRLDYQATRIDHVYYNGQSGEFGSGEKFTATKDYYTLIRSTPSEPSSVDPVSVSRDLVDASRRFGMYWERKFPDVLPSAFYSTEAAMESHLLSLKNNYVESLTELGELVRLVPDFPLLIRALVLWRKDPSSAITAFGDFVSGFVLKFNFAWRPNAEAVSELNKVGPKLGSALDRFGDSRTITVSGKFNYTFPRHPYWGGDMRLETRSTARIEYVDSDFVQFILKLDSLGLLPDLHRVWETLPYSYAVDWVASVGRRLHDIDSQVKLFSLMQLHWVEHSFNISTPVPSHISLQGVKPLSGDLKLVYHSRNLSRRMPPLRDSIYDFRESAGVPNHGVLASLLYQHR